jgi:hypothetical protein
MSCITEEDLGGIDRATNAMWKNGYQDQVAEEIIETAEKTQDTIEQILAIRNEEVYKSIGQGSVANALAMIRGCSVEVNIDVTITVENSGNGNNSGENSGNVGSSDNSNSSSSGKECSDDKESAENR